MGLPSKILAVIIVTASVPSFRRAGLGFTDKGTAFHPDQLSEDQLKALHAEKKLSVREVQSDAIPEGVDTEGLESYLASTRISDAQKAEAPPASKAKSTKATAGTTKATDSDAGNAGA